MLNTQIRALDKSNGSLKTFHTGNHIAVNPLEGLYPLDQWLE